MRSAINPGDDVIDRGAARRVRQVIPAPRAAPVLQLHQFGHECQAVRRPRHNLVVKLPRTSPGARRPAAELLAGRYRQPAHTAPARLGRHEVKLTARSDTAAAVWAGPVNPCLGTAGETGGVGKERMPGTNRLLVLRHKLAGGERRSSRI